MSGYKMFADRLDYAFKEARTRYTEAYHLMLSKKRDMEDIQRNPSLADTFGMKAEYDYNQAKAAFKKRGLLRGRTSSGRWRRSARL